VARVRSALTGVAGVESAQVNYQKAEAVVKYDPAKAKPEALVAAVRSAGYGAELQGEQAKSGQESKPKKARPAAGKKRADAASGNGNGIASDEPGRDKTTEAEKIDPERQIVFKVKGLT